MTSWSSFYPWILPEVRGCPQPLIDQKLRDAAREFCTRSRAWEERAATVTADGTTSLRSFVFAEAGSELVRVERATVAGEDQTILNSDGNPADWLETAPADELSDTLVVVSRTQYRIWPTPVSGAAIVIYQALKPTNAGTGVGDVIYAEWGEQLARGAVARLKAMKGSAWFDADGAMLADRAFERAVHSAANWKFKQSRRLRTKKAPI